MQTSPGHREDPFDVVGMWTRTTNAEEADPSTARLPDLWARALEDPYLAARRAPQEAGFVAVLTDYEGDETGAYTEVVGVRTEEGTHVPDGYVVVTVPPAPRVRVPARGPMPDALVDAWRRIWARSAAGELRRAFGTDYEVHGPDGADVYVSVRSG